MYTVVLVLALSVFAQSFEVSSKGVNACASSRLTLNEMIKCKARSEAVPACSTQSSIDEQNHLQIKLDPVAKYDSMCGFLVPFNQLLGNNIQSQRQVTLSYKVKLSPNFLPDGALKLPGLGGSLSRVVWNDRTCQAGDKFVNECTDAFTIRLLMNEKWDLSLYYYAPEAEKQASCGTFHQISGQGLWTDADSANTCRKQFLGTTIGVGAKLSPAAENSVVLRVTLLANNKIRAYLSVNGVGGEVEWNFPRSSEYRVNTVIAPMSYGRPPHSTAGWNLRGRIVTENIWQGLELWDMQVSGPLLASALDRGHSKYAEAETSINVMSPTTFGFAVAACILFGTVTLIAIIVSVREIKLNSDLLSERV